MPLPSSLPLHGVPRPPQPLAQVLGYRQPAIVDRFAATWDLGADEADELWADTLRWLWLCASHRATSLVITPSMTLVDELWHAFILSTRAYAAFCDDHLGGYVHHQPGVEDSAATADQQRAALRAQIARVYQQLGPDVAARWYDGYQRRYPVASLGQRFRAWGRPAGAP